MKLLKDAGWVLLTAVAYWAVMLPATAALRLFPRPADTQLATDLVAAVVLALLSAVVAFAWGHELARRTGLGVWAGIAFAGIALGLLEAAVALGSVSATTPGPASAPGGTLMMLLVFAGLGAYLQARWARWREVLTPTAPNPLVAAGWVLLWVSLYQAAMVACDYFVWPLMPGSLNAWSLGAQAALVQAVAFALAFVCGFAVAHQTRTGVWAGLAFALVLSQLQWQVADNVPEYLQRWLINAMGVNGTLWTAIYAGLGAYLAELLTRRAEHRAALAAAPTDPPPAT